MKIDDITLADLAGRSRLSARITWEETDRPACDVHFETDQGFSDALSAVPDPFLSASVTAALWAGERRIQVDGEVCPVLLENLDSVAALFQHWFHRGDAPLRIEARSRGRALEQAGAPRAAVFFSGGLDALAACRANRLRFPLTHPAAIRDGIIVFGLEVEDPVAFGYVLDRLGELASDTGITLLPVSTNVRILNPSWQFWYDAHMGPALCAVAHALGRRLSHVTIGSDYDAAHLVPHGSHPLVEPHFTSESLRVQYHGLTMSRLAKARLVAGWPAALRNLRVCNRPDAYRPGQLNCGTCEKCVRTMLELMAAGAFDAAPVFAHRTVTPAMIAGLYMPPAVEPYYEELVDPLSAAGRPDLGQAIAQRLATVRGETGFSGLLRRFDRDHLNGSMVSLKRALTTRRVEHPAHQEAQ